MPLPGPRFSARSSFDLAHNELSTALSRAREAGRTVLDLTESNPTRAGLPYPAEAILPALAAPGASSTSRRRSGCRRRARPWQGTWESRPVGSC